MDYLVKIVRRLSIKNIAVHVVGLVVSMAVVWGVSYLILVTFSIQESALVEPPIPVFVSNIKQASSTVATSTKKTVVGKTASSTATSTKSKK